MEDFYLLGWNTFYRDTIKLANLIKKDGYKPEMLIAIARGGWVVTRIISDMLEVDDVTDIHISFYTDIAKTKKGPIILEEPGKKIKDKNVLLLDDVSDTGESLIKAIEYIKLKEPNKIKTATVYVKPWTKFWPDYYVREINKWIIYPYEVKETVKKLWLRWTKEGKDEEWITKKLNSIGIAKWQLNLILKDLRN